MILNSKKFQAIIINRQNRSNHNCCLTISNVEIKSKESVTLLVIEIDNKFNYGPLIWHFTTRKGIKNVEKVQQRSLEFILNAYDKTYFQLLDISKKPSMEVKRLRILITEIFKTLNDSNPVFMKDIFHYCQNKSHKKHNLHVHSRNNNLRVLGAHTWNSLPENIKPTDSIYEL